MEGEKGSKGDKLKTIDRKQGWILKRLPSETQREMGIL